ncbi:MAG: hypothetical protein ACJ8EF_21485 [Bradyrhizobium sp.]|jgi:hypothetical protein
MLKYVRKFTVDILPSIAATIIGAYIVNHYIVAKPSANAPAGLAASTADPKKAEVKNDAKPSDPAAIVSNVPEAGVKPRGLLEKPLTEKTTGEKPALVEKPPEKSTDKSSETASIPTQTRRHQPSPRERTKPVAMPSQPSPPAVTVAPVIVAPSIAVPSIAPATEAANAPDDHRDANELARAAIERLRSAEGSPRAKEPARAPEPTGLVAVQPAAPSPLVRSLPPAVVVSTPAAETLPGTVGIDNSRRPSPPADIPAGSSLQPPLDLRAEAQPPRREHSSVAEEMLLAAKSVFHSVLPK